MLTLPDIIEDVLERKSNGMHDEIYEILRIARDTLFVDRDGIYITLKAELFNFDQQTSDVFYKALSRLAHRVISEWDNIGGSKKKTTLRTESIFSLYAMLRQSRLHKEIGAFVFHQLLLVAFNNHDHNDQDDWIYKLHVDALTLRGLRYHDMRFHESFLQFIRYIEATRIVGLPEITSLEILDGFDILLDTAIDTPHPSVQSQLDSLFRHFLAQDPEMVEYPSTRYHQSQTLEMWIAFARKKRWYCILAVWKDLLLEESSTLDPVIELDRIAIENYSRSYGCREFGLTSADVDVWNLEDALSIIEDHLSFQRVLRQALEAIGDNAEVTQGEETNVHHPHADALFTHTDRDSFPGNSVSVVELEKEGKSEGPDPGDLVDRIRRFFTPRGNQPGAP